MILLSATLHKMRAVWFYILESTVDAYGWLALMLGQKISTHRERTSNLPAPITATLNQSYCNMELPHNFHKLSRNPHHLSSNTYERGNYLVPK